jgi:cystathionine beta-lyase/cystathionine gamma-synthase
VRQFIDGLERFRIGVSWGGVESLVLSPNRGNNLSYLDSQRIPHNLIRVSIGLEGADVLIEDIDESLSALPR